MAPLIAHRRGVGSGPYVLCVHSSSSSSGQWRPLMNRLAPLFRVVFLELVR